MGLTNDGRIDRPRQNRRFTDRRDGDGKPSVFRRPPPGLDFVVEAMHDHGRERKPAGPAVSPAERKLAEIIAYARLSAEAAKRTASLLVASPATELLDEVREETGRIKGRAIQLADSLDNREEIRELSYEIHDEGTATFNSFLRPGFTAIEGLDYLAMAQAEMMGHWAMLQNLDPSPEITELAEWALPKLREQLRSVASAAARFDRRGARQSVELD